MDEDLLAEFMKKGPWAEDAVKNHPLGDLRTDYPREEIRAMQDAMVAWATHFEKPELDDLRFITELTVLFFYFLRRWNIDSVDHRHVMYMNESTFVGADSFRRTCAMYRITHGAIPSELPQRVESLDALKQQYMAMYHSFVAEMHGEKKCRLLLDLYKLQIVFAGLTYD